MQPFLFLADPLLSLFQPPTTLEASATSYEARNGEVRREGVVRMRIDKKLVVQSATYRNGFSAGGSKISTATRLLASSGAVQGMLFGQQ